MSHRPEELWVNCSYFVDFIGKLSDFGILVMVHSFIIHSCKKKVLGGAKLC